MCRQERQTYKWQVCGVALAEPRVSRASSPPWSIKICVTSSLPPPKSPDNFHSEASPCHFLVTYSLHLTPVFLPSHNLFVSLHSHQSYPLPSPLDSPPFPMPLANNKMSARQSSFPPLLQHCPISLLSMLGSLGCHVPATYAHAAAYHASLGRPTIA